jgi:histidyl-tRNA synthetase
MAKKIEALRGMDDILPGEVEKWQWLEQQARVFFEGFGFREIRTPILEYTELFSRGVGEGSDIVRKEMFSFQDRGDRDVTMRPEMTASVARSVIEKGLLSQAKSLHFYYMGPMFRAERPQAGRKRQFHQIGIEIINESGVKADFHAVCQLYLFLRKLGVNQIELRINDLGSVEDQKKTAEKLREYFLSQKDGLCEDCRDRLDKNVLRIFDCKNPKCQPVIVKAPWEEIAPKSPEFEEIKRKLDLSQIPYQVQRRLVRGLDYYNGLVFEVASKALGAQDALAGGGRYDRLYSDLGGKPTPCIGFSIGMERLLTSLGDISAQKARENVIYFAPIMNANDFGRSDALKIFDSTVTELAQLGMKPIYLDDFDLKFDNHLKNALRANARYMVILGPDELAKKKWKLKDMDNRTETFVEWGKLFTAIKQVNV